MKKVTLSATVILVFILFSIHQRTEGSDTRVVAPATSSNSSQDILTTPAPATSSGNPPAGQTTSQTYKNGTYTGDPKDAFYGNIQVQATITNGKIADVVFLQYPNDRRDSIEINIQAMPYLKQEAIQAQSATVDIVSGATDSSQAFRESLATALAKAQ